MYVFCVTVHPVILSEISDLSDENRDMVNFTCEAIGEPVPVIQWYFNIMMLSHNSSKYMIQSELINLTTTKSTLTIFNAISSDVGVYTCNASNILSSDVAHG